MQLPPSQLTEALNMCTDLRNPLREHLSSFTEAQRAHIPSAVQEIVMNSYTISAPSMAPTSTNSQLPVMPQPGMMMIPNSMHPSKDEVSTLILELF